MFQKQVIVLCRELKAGLSHLYRKNKCTKLFQIQVTTLTSNIKTEIKLPVQEKGRHKTIVDAGSHTYTGD